MKMNFLLGMLLLLVALQPEIKCTKEATKSKKANSWIADGYKKDTIATIAGSLTPFFTKQKTVLGCAFVFICGALAAKSLYRTLTISGRLYDVSLDLEELRQLRVFKAVKEKGDLLEAFGYDRFFPTKEELSDNIHRITRRFMHQENLLEWIKARTESQELIKEIEDELVDLRQDIKDLQSIKK